MNASLAGVFVNRNHFVVVVVLLIFSLFLLTVIVLLLIRPFHVSFSYFFHLCRNCNKSHVYYRFCHHLELVWFFCRRPSELLSQVIIRQQGESQNGGNKKQSTSNFPKNKHFLYPNTHVRVNIIRTRTCRYNTHTYVCVSGGRKYSFSGEFCGLCFLISSVLRSTLLLYCRR